MQAKNLPGQLFIRAVNGNIISLLPLLPGNQYADPTITRYHKTQLLGVKDGSIQGKHRKCVTVSNRENNQFARERKSRLAEIHERRRSHVAHRHATASSTFERRYT